MEDFYRVTGRLPPYVFEEVEQGQGEGPQRRCRTSSISAWAIRICRHPRGVAIEKLEDYALGKPRTDRYSASRGVPGFRGAPGCLLRPRLRREAQSRHPDRKGKASFPGRVRLMRRRPSRRRATWCWYRKRELPHPCVRLSNGGSGNSLGTLRADAGLSFTRWSARSSIQSRSRLPVVVH